MDFYTSYYANIKNIPGDYAAIGISRFCPDWLEKGNGPSNFYFWEDNQFAPSVGLLDDMKHRGLSEKEYAARYYGELDGRFHFTLDSGKQLFDYIGTLSHRFFDYNAIVFLCYERPEYFCHRKVLSAILRYFGFQIEELPCAKSENKSIEGVGAKTKKSPGANALF